MRWFFDIYGLIGESNEVTIGALYGLALGIGLAFLITIILVRKSNDVGSSKGSMLDFGGLYMIEAEDDLHRREPSGTAFTILSEHHEEEKAYYLDKKNSGGGLPEKRKLKKRRFGDGSIGEEKATRDIFKEKFGSQE